jgi:hypothetical protein
LLLPERKWDRPLNDTINTFLGDNRKRLFAIGFLILAALLIRILFFTGGVRGSDAYAYALHAFQIGTGQYEINTIGSFYGFRFTLLLPTALSYYLFGVSDYSSVVFLYLCSLLNILAAFLLAEKIFDRKTAIIAAALLAVYPLDIATANTLSPDSFIPVLSSLAILCYVMAENKPYASWMGRFYLFLTGLLIAFAYLSRITSVFLFAALLCHHLFRRQRLSALVWVVIGLAIPLIGEALYYTIHTGDPLFHYHRIAIHDSLVKGPDPDAIVSLLFYPKVMFGFDLTGWAFYGLMWWMVMAGLILSLYRKDKRMILPAVFLVIPFLGFEFGTQSLKETIPIMKNYNYLSLITCSATLIAAYAMREGFTLLFPNSRKRLPAYILTMAIIASMNMYGTYRLAQNTKNDAAPYVAVADAMRGQALRPIYVHHDRWPLFLRYFLRYDQALDFRMMNGMSKEQIENISGAYVVLHKRYLDADTAGRSFRQLPQYAGYLNSQPPKWDKILFYEGKPSYNTVTLFSVK